MNETIDIVDNTPKIDYLRQHNILPVVLGLVFFCYSIAAALLFQKLILANMTSMLASGTNLTADSTYFDSVAMKMADEIKLNGWSSWELFPKYNVSGNVSILAILYVVFGQDITLAIPLNAIFHALGGVMIFMLALELSSDYLTGIRAGIIASCIFIIFPSALSWYGQLLKDGYTIAAILAVLLIWLKGISTPHNTYRSFYLILLSTLALVFLFIFRPYFFKLTLVFAIIAFFVLVIWRVTSKKENCWVFFLYVILTFVPIHMFLNTIGGLSKASRTGDVYSEWNVNDVKKTFASLSTEKQHMLADVLAWDWEQNDFLPSAIDEELETVAKTRVGLIAYGIINNAGSLVDIKETPRNFIEIVKYAPRALQVSLLAPFPSSWLQKMSVMKVLTYLEMTVIYACLFGLVPLVKFNRNRKVVFTFCFSVFFLIIYGFISANVGTLYRLRYAFELLVVLLGVIGWVTYFNKRVIPYQSVKIKEIRPVSSILAKSPDEKSNLKSRKNVIGAGIVVSFLTLIGFFGFFLRDVLMANEYGFSKDFDGFFLALVIPMFVVNVFCTPLGSAFVPFLKKIIEQHTDINLSALVSNLISIILFVLFFLSILIYISSPTIFKSLFIDEQGATFTQNSSVLIVLPLIILTLSGALILGNATLITYGRLVIPSAAQTVVPIIAIMALLLFGSSYGVISVMAGMVIGQIVNLIVIQFFLKKYNLSLVPRFRPELNHELFGLWKLFLPLFVSAFFAGIMLPIDTLLASKLSDGSVAIFNFGAKIVFFISGLLGVVVSNVMLPYFSSMIEKKQMQLAKKELSFFMLLATFISIPVTILFYVYSENILRLIFFNDNIPVNDLNAIQSVMQYSLVQIPFLICNILLLKYATATRHLMVILISAFIGAILNVGLSIALMSVMGVSGIAFATSLAMITSSLFLLAVLMFYRHVSLLDMVIVFLNWMLFLTLIIGFHFQSLPSIVMTILSYAILVFVFSKLQNIKGENFVTY